MIAALLLLLAGSPWAWDRSDTSLAVGATAMFALDMDQTIDIGHNCRETNPILGPCPTPQRIAVFSAFTLVTQGAIAYALPNPYRKVFLSTWIVDEWVNTGHNFMVGAKLTF